jgi:signal transduction histidine kinase
LVDICGALVALNLTVLAGYIARAGADRIRFFTTLGITILLALCPALLRWTARVGVALAMLVVPSIATAVFLASQAGGLQAPTTLLLILAPMLVNLVFGDTSGFSVLALCILSLIGLAIGMGPRLDSEAALRPSVVVHLLTSIACTAAIHEIVRRYRARDRARQRTMQRHERLAGLGTVAAAVAHEINNPLSVVTMNSELLVSALSDPKYLEAAQDVQAASTQIGFIVAQLNETARSELPPPEDLAVDELIQSALKQLQARFIHPAQLEITGEPECRVLGIRPALIQVITNLLVNANYALDGQRDRRIRVTRYRDGEHIAIIVDDNGPGFPKALLQTMAEPFVTTRSEHGGLGLGLFIVESRVRESGGHLAFDTSPMGGARVEVRLLASVGTASDVQSAV